MIHAGNLVLPAFTWLYLLLPAFTGLAVTLQLARSCLLDLFVQGLRRSALTDPWRICSRLTPRLAQKSASQPLPSQLQGYGSCKNNFRYSGLAFCPPASLLPPYRPTGRVCSSLAPRPRPKFLRHNHRIYFCASPYRSMADMLAPHSSPCAKTCFATTSLPTAG